MPERFPEHLRAFVDASVWTFAVTYPKWPHHYIVRDRVDEALFDEVGVHIRTHGEPQRFYRTSFIYFEEDGLLYWLIEDVINRCRVEESYESRLAAGTLPP